MPPLTAEMRPLHATPPPCCQKVAPPAGPRDAVLRVDCGELVGFGHPLADVAGGKLTKETAVYTGWARAPANRGAGGGDGHRGPRTILSQGTPLSSYCQDVMGNNKNNNILVEHFQPPPLSPTPERGGGGLGL